MTTSVRRAAVFVAVLAAPTCWAVSADDWNRMSEPMQAAYVGGVIDTWRNYASIEEEYPSGKRTAAELTLALAYDCLDPDMSHRQVRAMVARWLTQHPDHLQISMASVVWTAVTDNCSGVREWKPSKARKAAAK